MRVDPKNTRMVRALIAQHNRLSTNKIFDPKDPQTKIRIDAIEKQLRDLDADKTHELARGW